MKQMFTSLLLLLVVATGAWAQQALPSPAGDSAAAVRPASIYTYGTLRMAGGPLLKKGFHMHFDWGQEDWFETLKHPQTKEPILFNSAMDAVNYMARQGWELMQVVEEKRHDRTLWVLRKQILLHPEEVYN